MRLARGGVRTGAVGRGLVRGGNFWAMPWDVWMLALQTNMVRGLFEVKG
jgi:hypothetical protein